MEGLALRLREFLSEIMGKAVNSNKFRCRFCLIVNKLVDVFSISSKINTVYGKRSFLSKESDTLRSYGVYTSPLMQASSALRSA